ncbi:MULTISPECIES: thioesterase II family protein [Streptomyces]|uniref:Surfactin synthase thioesterase subunit n=1 Tax=Streptomyces misionensis TaxID=67331 RepID=A0A1H5FF36_9ACTN|nr:MULTISPECIES: alpha/beta fold hydrolase [Streptomyces]SEE01976.1 Surfactin synthase thioesterase subunit [Streptomyces misionensis]SFY49412.1 Phenyloxazoline synthase MbtB [Streptomyces sp. F-1]
MTTAFPTGDLWVRRFHPAPPTSARLVCFPHAGGSATFYFPLATALRGAADVLVLQYPGRQDRYEEKGIETIAELADQAYEALRPYADRPLTFFGHSMGSIVAFEVARRFERDGEGPAHLFASARRAPSAYACENVHLRDDDGLIEEMRKLSGTDPRLLGDEDLLRMILPALRSDYTAIETYRAPADAVVEAPLTVLTGDRDPRVTPEEAHAWREHTTGPFDLKVFSGGHFYLTDHIVELSEILTG